MGIPFSIMRFMIPCEKLWKFNSSNTTNRDAMAIAELGNYEIGYDIRQVMMYSLDFSIILEKS
jgi:hypothetical protein